MTERPDLTDKISRGVLSGLTVITLTFVLAACGEDEVEPPPPPKPPPSVPVDDRPLEPALPFHDASGGSGVDLDHFTGGFMTEAGGHSRYLVECMGPGVVLLDMDGDGDLDLFAPNGSTFPQDPKLAARGSPRSRLYRCEGPFRYSDVTDEWKLEIRGHALGGTAADYDGDGDVDLLVTGWDCTRLLRNDGTRFTDVTAEAGLVTPGWTDRSGVKGPDWSTSATFFDCDEDGDLDLFVCMYARWCPENDVMETLNGRDKSFAAPTPYDGNTCRLYLNDGDGKFQDRTDVSGVTVVDQDGYPKAKALGVALWDFNGDERLDLVVANDGAPNFLFLSREPGRYKDSAVAAAIAYDEDGRTRAGMGIDAVDIYNDGGVAVPIGNFSGEPVSLYLKTGHAFKESSQAKNISASTQAVLTFGLKCADMDLDGLQDIVLANGHLEPEIQEVKAAIRYRQRLRILRNLGNYFRDWTDACGPGLDDPFVGRGLAVADLDGDGDLDLIAGDNGGRTRLLRNDQQTGNHWLRVRLVGKSPNTQAIGAWISLVANNQSQRRLVTTASSYASLGELTQTFGLGGSTSVDSLTIRWPSGETQEVKVTAVDREIVIKQGG